MDAMDADGNGTLSAGEVTQGLEGHGLTPEQKAAVWQVYASDEAKAKYKAAQAVGAGEQYILMLPMLDADKSGRVSTKELESAMNGRGDLTRKQQAALWYEYASDKQRMNYEKAAEYGLESALFGNDAVCGYQQQRHIEQGRAAGLAGQYRTGPGTKRRFCSALQAQRRTHMNDINPAAATGCRVFGKGC